MKKYYLHDGTESSGPFDFEELISKKINPKTPVWFEGLDTWKFANELTELNNLFQPIPPPISTLKEKPILEKTEIKPDKKQILGLSKITFFIVLTVLLLIVITVAFNTLNENKKRELDAKNRKTEIENYQLELKEKELQEQKILLEQAEKVAAMRAIQERAEAKAERIIEIDKLIAISESNLATTRTKLTSAEGFKVGRTVAEKNEELNALQIQIDSIDKNINQLKIESNKLKSDLQQEP